MSLPDITSQLKVDTALEDKEEEEEMPHDITDTVMPLISKLCCCLLCSYHSTDRSQHNVSRVL